MRMFRRDEVHYAESINLIPAMKTEQLLWTAAQGWQKTSRGTGTDEQHPFDLVLVFGDRDLLETQSFPEELQTLYPGAHCVSCSTSGEILDASVYDETITATAIGFEGTTFSISSLNIRDAADSTDAGEKLAQDIATEGLRHILLLSDGQLVNGSGLLEGMYRHVPQDVLITGGLAGDRARFRKTLVGVDDAIEEGNIVAIALYGSHLKIGHGSIGGWDSFGPDRLVTRSDGNVLYELDGQRALDLYKRYLDTLADDLPGSALLFPLSIRTSEHDAPLVRTILSIDEEHGSMTFAGDIPQGSYARLMKANFDRLVDGAFLAAQNSVQIGDESPELAILISCVGRKLVLGQRTEEEIEAVREVLGHDATVTGFYSYGEISPLQNSLRCELHNQTMTITTFSER